MIARCGERTPRAPDVRTPLLVAARRIRLATAVQMPFKNSIRSFLSAALRFKLSVAVIVVDDVE